MITPHGQPSAPSTPRTAGWAGLLLVIAVILAYANALHAPFVFDDQSSIVHNASIRHLWPPAAADIGGTRGRPVANLTFALNYAWSGLSVAPFHLFNLAVHAGAALLLFGLVRRTLRLPARTGEGAIPSLDGGSAVAGGCEDGAASRSVAGADAIAFLASLVWAVHPLQTEAVTYLAQRTELLMAFFYLATLYAFVRSVGPTARPLVWRGIAVAACAAGMGSKEVMVTAPLAVLLFDRAFIAGTFAGAWRTRRGFYAALATTWVVLLVLIRGIGNRGVGFAYDVDSWHYALFESRALWRYVALAVWPHPLVFDYGAMPPVTLGQVWPYGVGIVVLLAVACALLARKPRLGFLAAWPFLILAPSSSIIPVALQPVAEHRMYLPVAALVVAAAIALHRALGRSAIIAAALAWGGAGVVLTHVRNDAYHDAVSLWSDTLRKCPNNDRAEGNLGQALLAAGQPGEAEPHLKRALLLNPGNVDARCNLALILQHQGRTGPALQLLAETEVLNPRFAQAWYQRGSLLLESGRLHSARHDLAEAVRLDEDNAAAHNNLAVVLSRLGDHRAAVAQYTAALALGPAPDLYVNRGDERLYLAQPAEAAADYQRALALNPQFKPALDKLTRLRRIVRRPL